MSKQLAQLSKVEFEHTSANVAEMLAADKTLQVLMTVMTAAAYVFQSARTQLTGAIRGGWRVDHPDAVIEYLTRAATQESSLAAKAVATTLLDVVIPYLDILQRAADDQAQAIQAVVGEAATQQGATSEVLFGSVADGEAGLGTVAAPGEAGQDVDGG
jgi:hypothetical protein